ncbi:hypothetical protein CIPAW_03G100300 [Carya illinoinensis]|uniref:DUF4378 domain-containing protein n=2 Tax=Carya illinoinensis TaxID=32201 RepID=A0A8T1QZ11_CARIL|nr:hypothetical protein CIPAW_03G100300 [Carya illinoinensis]
MGREWYWGGRSSKRGGAGGEKDASSSGCMNAVFQFFDFHQFRFALHHRKPSFEPTCILPEEPTNPKGVGAPRNSLQSEELSLSCITREGEEEEEEDFNIPIGIQIKTSGLRGSKAGAPNDFSSEISSSPGIKTPNLVARLMGLDLLPETRSPFSYSSAHGTQNPLPKSHSHRLRPPQPLQSRLRNILDYDITGTRSLPETPRISSARRSNVDHRLSLQINKENLSASEDLEFSRFSYLRRKERRGEEENNRSPSEHARQIVKQLKEKVSRKVGMDITNTITNRDQGRSTELVNQFKSRKYSKAFTKVVEEYSSPGKHSAPSCSPRLRSSEPKIKSSTTQASSKDKSFHYPKPSSSSLSSSQNVQPQPIKVSVMKLKPQPLQKQQQQGPKRIKKCEKIEGERFHQRLKKPPQTSDIIRNKQEEPFVRRSIAPRANIPEKKCKKTPLSNDLLNITVPTLLTVKKEPSQSATKIPQKQFQVFDAQKSRCSSQLSSCTSQYKPETTDKLMARESNDDRFNGDSTTGACGAEYEYVSNILRRTGIDKETCMVSFSNWFSPSHPLDPAILHELEYTGTDTSTAIFTSESQSTGIMPGRLGLGCNQKLLLFHLVDELLVEILKPTYIDMKQWASSKNGPGFCHMQGSQLIEKLCAKIRSFPCADCRVLEDIDALIDKDIPRLKLQSAMACEEEGEEIVTEIEKDILDTLVRETAMEFW